MKNRLSYKRLERGITSYKTFHDTKPFIEHLQPFGRKYFIHISLEQRKAGSKFILKAKIGHFVEYNSETTKIYYIYISSEHKVVETRQVKFAPFVPNHTEETDKLLPKTIV